VRPRTALSKCAGSSFDPLSRPNEVDPIPAAANNLALVKGVGERMLLQGDLRPLLDRLADHVVFTVATLGSGGLSDSALSPPSMLDRTALL
jgi:hypothetical protein